MQPTPGARAARRPLGHDAVTLDPRGWLGSWQALNRAATLPHSVAQLEATGSVDNLRRVAGEFSGPRRCLWFSDSDLYKTLEAAGWELAAGGEPRQAYLSLTALLARAQAQASDSYLHSWFGVDGRERWSDLTNGHEMYCAGHLIQAGVAAARSGDGQLLEVAQRFADLLAERFGDDDAPAGQAADGGRAAIDGHPEIEMALVELWRQTGQREYLDLAAKMVERRGHGSLGQGSFGSACYLDHQPVRDSTTVTGHAVRQLYLLCGATDVAVETGDAALLHAVERQWLDAYGTKTYLTGGHGSRHRDEAFGDPYELPPDRAYNETCAAIASVMLNWRLLLATGRRRYADQMEHALYNAVAVGLSADGTRFFYTNPLQLRAGHDGAQEDSPAERLRWYRCPCCPPNLARLGATLHHYVATGGGDEDADGLQLHLYAAGRITAELGQAWSSSTWPRPTPGRAGSRSPLSGPPPRPGSWPCAGRAGARRSPSPGRTWPRTTTATCAAARSGRPGSRSSSNSACRVLSTMAGYGFGRYRFRGRGLIFAITLLALMIPYQAILTPAFLELNYLHLTNSLLGLILFYSTFNLPFGVFVMRNTFSQIPGELEDSAQVDGRGR